MNESNDIDSNLQTALQSCLNDLQYDRVRTVGASLAKGLTLAEACIISQVDIDKLLALSAKYRPVEDYITFKQTTFKASIIKQLSTQALNGDTKLAIWFTERLDDLNPRPKDDTPDNPLVQGLDFIRKNGDASPLTVKDIA